MSTSDNKPWVHLIQSIIGKADTVGQVSNSQTDTEIYRCET